MRTLCFTLAILCTPLLLVAEPLTLSKDGKTEYVIALPAEPTVIEQTAAKELKEHLDAVTGADFAIVKETPVVPAQAGNHHPAAARHPSIEGNNSPPSEGWHFAQQNDGVVSTKPQLIVGNSMRLKELLPDLDVTKIPYDGIVIKSVGDNIIFVGHPQRGTLYAVNTFLEDAVGVRWWTSTESFIPKKPTLTVPAQNVEYAPQIINREAYYLDAIGSVFTSRLKYNGSLTHAPAEYGGHHKFFHFVHSFFPLLPPDKYFAAHPEWYSEINGQRKHEHAQLCLTNDEMRAELTKNAIEGLRKNPDAKFISISQNDWYGYCTCAKCKAIDDEEGSHAGTLIRFVNKVAEEIEKEFPDVWVETLAYQYTRKPPKSVKPRKNVIIRLCTIECSFVQPLATGEQNKDFREDMEGWSKIADNLFVWDYTVNFSAYMLPHPNHRVLAPNIRFFVDNNTIGLFEQGDSYCSAGDFVRMKNWVISKLMWNPSLDENKLFDEFLMGYYGPTFGPALKKYLNILHDRAEESGVHLQCFMNSTNDWLDFDTWQKVTVGLLNLGGDDFYNRADKTVLRRFERDTVPIGLVFLKEFYSFQRKSGATELKQLFDNPQRLLDGFFGICKEHNVRAYREYDKPEHFAAFEADMRARFGPPADPPEFTKDLPKNSWYEVQNCEFNMHKLGEWTFSVEDEKASNKRATKMPGDHHEWATSYTFDRSLLDLSVNHPAAARHPSIEGNNSPPSEGWHFAQQNDGVVSPLYHLYAAVRCEAKEGIEGTAMTLGVYDYENKKGVTSKTLSVAEIGGAEYHWIDLGVLPLRPGFNVWFAPPRRPGEVDAVYIDRFVVVREK